MVDVSTALGMDSRIASSYLDAGLGWGGSCLPKDISSLIWTANRVGVATPMLSAVVKINTRQGWLAVSKLKDVIGDLRGKTVAIWGLSFKPNCDDVRDSQSLNLVRHLIAEGASVRAYDPVAMEQAARLYPEISYATDAYDAAKGADALVLATAWPQFGTLDLAKVRSLMRRPLLLDARNTLDVATVTGAGLVYLGIGRPMSGPEFDQQPQELAQHLRGSKTPRGFADEREEGLMVEYQDARLTNAAAPADVRVPAVIGAGRPSRLLKRAFDIVVSFVALAALSPLFLVIALAIKLDSRGPALFKQERLGRDLKPFSMYKFRSMRARRRRQPPPRVRQADGRIQASRNRHLQVAGRSAGDPGRPLSAGLEPGRAAEPGEHPAGRYEHRRAAPGAGLRAALLQGLVLLALRRAARAHRALAGQAR